MAQKKIEDLKFQYNIDQILEILWKIRYNDKFYFITYGKDMLEKLIKQKNSAKNIANIDELNIDSL